MAQSDPNCLICGAELVFAGEAQPVVCSICGAEGVSAITCQNGHYVCNDCHRQKGVDFALEFCAASSSTNAVQILRDMMCDKSVFPSGPEHHTLDGAAVIAAFCNAGGEINGGAMTKEAALEEMKARSLQVPGGACGYWGCCGAAVSVGQALSIIIGSTPSKREEWGHCQRLTGATLSKLGEMGGPACCKRTGFTAVLEASAYLNEHFGGRIDIPESVVCTFCGGNKYCLRYECPYFPKKK